MKSLLSFAVFALGTFSASTPLAQPQGYPAKPVRFIINFPQGRCTGSRRGGWFGAETGHCRPGYGTALCGG